MDRKSALPWLICGFAGLFYFYEYLLRILPSVMPMQIAHAFHLNAGSFGNLAGVFYYIYVPMQLLVGIFIDRFAPRRLLAFALLCCILGAYLFGSSHHLWVAMLGRFFMGFGSAFAFVGVLKLGSMWLPDNRFAFLAGVTASLGMLGGLVGEFLLTTLLHTQGWRLTHYGIACFGVFLALIIFCVLVNEKRYTVKPLQSYLLPDLKAGYQGLKSLLKKPQMWINCIIGCLIYVPVSGFAETWGLSYLMEADHFSKSVAAAALSMVFLGWIVGAPIVGWFSGVVKQRRLPLTFGAAMAAVLLSIVLYVPGLTASAIFYLLFLFGLFSSVQVVIFSISRDICPNLLTATVVALTNMFVMLAGLSIPVIGAVLNLLWGKHDISRIPMGAWYYQVALAILPLCLVSAVLMTFCLEDSYGDLTMGETDVSPQQFSG